MLATASTEGVLHNLDPATNYTYAVVAYTSGGESAPTNTIVVLTSDSSELIIRNNPWLS